MIKEGLNDFINLAYKTMGIAISIYTNVRSNFLILATFVIYYVSILFFLPLIYEDRGLIPIVPAVGIALAAMFLFGYKIWPGILICTFAANFSFFAFNEAYTIPAAIAVSVLMSTVSTGEIAFGFFLIRKVDINIYKLESIKHVFHFFVITLITCLTGSLFSTFVLSLISILPSGNFVFSWVCSSLAGTVGILTITPLLIEWSVNSRNGTGWAKKEMLLVCLVGIVTFFVSGMFFCNWLPGFLLMKPYLMILLFFSVAFYFELKFLTIIIAISSFVAIYGVLSGNGYFVSASLVESCLSLQLYIITITVTTFLVKAALNERKQARITLQLAHDNLLENMNERSDELFNYQGRVNAIFKTLVKYTVMDFSQKIPVSVHGDEIDAIANGLNTLGEELAESNAAQLKYANELEQTNLLLIDSEQQIQSIFNNAPDSVIVIDMDNVVLRWNPQAEYVFGWKKDEAVGKKLYNLIVPKRYRKMYVEGEWHFFQNGSGEVFNRSCELEAVNKHGNEFPISLSISPVMMEGKYMFIGFIRDVSEQKKTERKIKQLAAIVESSDDAIFSQTMDGMVLSWNKAAEKIYGYSAEEVLGKSISLTSPSEELNEFGKIPQRLQQGEPIINIETQKLKKNGEKIYVSLTASAIKDNDGNITAISLISRDITANKKIALEMQRITEELKRSNAELEQFAYVASHDLQEPLRMVTSYLQLLEKRYKNELDKDAVEFIHFAVDGSNRMRNLIHSLLEYSRINRVKPFEWIDTNELMGEVLVNLETSINENNAVIRVNKMPQIFGDYVLINQLFQNLICNAIKFRNEGPLLIVISGKEIGDEYLFSVEDNGIGIKKEYSDKIFIIFKRLHSKEKYPGTGMGLAICKKIVERHQGKIWVESLPENGSIFNFTIKKQNS